MSDTELECTPPEVLETAKVLVENLLPAKSNSVYQMPYQRFLKWCEEKKSCPQVLSQRTNRYCPYDVCDNSFNYPKETVNRALEENNIYRQVKSYFGTVSAPQLKSAAAMANGTNKRENYEPVCRGTRLVTYPRSLTSVKMVNHTIINTDDVYQAVEFDYCSSNDKCEGVIEGDFEVCCAQQFVNIDLIVLVEMNRTEIFQTFKVPSTCACTFRRL